MLLAKFPSASDCCCTSAESLGVMHHLVKSCLGGVIFDDAFTLLSLEASGVNCSEAEHFRCGCTVEDCRVVFNAW